MQIAREREQILATALVVEDLAHAEDLEIPVEGSGSIGGCGIGVCVAQLMIGLPAMGATYLMSYPGPNWQIRGGENFRSQTRTPTQPEQGVSRMAHAVRRHRARRRPILVMPPAAGRAAAHRMIYTANAGQLFQHATAGPSCCRAWRWRTDRPSGRPLRVHGARRAWRRRREPTWEGQADCRRSPAVASSPPGACARTGVSTRFARCCRRAPRSSTSSPGAVLPRRHLPGPAQQPRRRHVLLALRRRVRRLATAATSQLPRRPRGARGRREDALGYACNALCVNGTVFLPAGFRRRCAAISCGAASPRGADFRELFGKGGGGPRCLVNELRGLVVNPGAPDYASLRDELHAVAARGATSRPIESRKSAEGREQRLGRLDVGNVEQRGSATSGP